MKKIAFLFFVTFIFFQCSENTPPPSPDIEYEIDNVRVLIPREYQKVSSKKEIKEISRGEDSIFYLDEFLFERMLSFDKNHHWFVKLEDTSLTYLILKTDGPRVYLSTKNTDYLIEQYEHTLEEKFLAKDTSYSFKRLENKLSGAFAIKYLKFKYTHHENGKDWYNTNYLMYANNRTIGMGIISSNKDYQDLEDHLDFIRIK